VPRAGNVEVAAGLGQQCALRREAGEPVMAGGKPLPAFSRTPRKTSG
jgi:hypothetical protein